MPTFYTISSGNINDSNIYGVTNINTETSSATACYNVTTADDVIISSTLSNGLPIQAIALPISSYPNNVNDSVLYLTLQSSLCSNTYSYYISSFFNDNIPDSPYESITQNIHTLQLSSEFYALSGDRISLKCKTSSPSTLQLIGNIDCVDVSDTRLPLQRSTSTQPAVNVSGRFIDSNSIALLDGAFYRDQTAFTYISSISSNNFTFEAWVYPLTNAVQYGSIFDIGSKNSLGDGIAGKRIIMMQNVDNLNNIGFYIPNNTSSSDTIITATTGLPLSAWSHIALVRNVSSCFCYLNGTRVASATGVNFNFNNNTPGIRELIVGSFNNRSPVTYKFNGYISDFRILANTAAYTGSSFSVPTAPPVLNANTIFQIGTGINLNRSFITSLNNNLSSFPLQSNISNYPISSKDVSNITDSVLFISTSSHYLTGVSNTNFNLTNNFSFETYLYLNSLPTTGNYFSIFSLGTANADATLTFTIGNSSMQIISNGVVTGNIPHFLTTNQWVHIAWVRCNNIIYCYTNKILRGKFEFASSISAPGNVIWLGRDSSNTVPRYFNGYIATAKLTNGNSIYTDTTIAEDYAYHASPNTVFLFKYPHASSTTSFSYFTAPKVDELHVSSCIKTTNAATDRITINAESISVYGNLHVHNNATLAIPYNRDSSFYVYGSKGIIIHNNSYITVGESGNNILPSVKSIFNLFEGINIHNSGYLNVYGYTKTPATHLKTDSISGVTTFTTTNNILSTTWLSGDIVGMIPVPVSAIDTTPNFDILQITNFSNISTFNTSTVSIYNHPSAIVIPAVVNLTRNVIIQPISSNKIYLRSVNNSTTNLNGVLFNNLGSSLISKNGISIGTNENGSFTINNCVISGNNLNTTNSNIGKMQLSLINNISDEKEYSLYLPPATPNTFITPNFSKIPSLTGDFTFDGWFYDLGENADATLLGFYDTDTNTFGSPVGIRIYRTTNNRIALRYYAGNLNNVIDIVSRPNVFVPHVWTHVSLTRENNLINLIVNGEDVGCSFTVDDIYPFSIRPVSAANIAYNYIRIGGAPNSGAANVTFGGYIYDFRINNSVAVKPDVSSITSVNLSTDIFRLSRSFSLRDVSPVNNTIYNNSNIGFMEHFSPVYKPLNNIQIKDNILLQSNGVGLKLQNTNINSSVLTGNFALSCSRQNYVFSKINANSVIMQNNYATSPTTAGIESTYIINCKSTNSTIGGTVNYNPSTTGVLVAGVNDAVVGNIVCLSGLSDGIILDSFNYNYDNTIFNNITANFNKNSGFRPIIFETNAGDYKGLSSPIKINLNNSTFIENNIAIEAYNMHGILSNVSMINNRVGVYGSLSNNNTYFDKLTALVTKNDTYVSISSGYQANFRITYLNSMRMSKIVDYDDSYAFMNIGDGALAIETTDANGRSFDTFLPYNNFTAEFWLYLENYPIPRTASTSTTAYNDFHCPVGINGYYNFGVDNKGIIKFFIKDGDSYGRSGSIAGSDCSPLHITTTTVPLSTWVHLALTVYNNGTWRVFYNGVSQERKNITTAGANATRTFIPTQYIDYGSVPANRPIAGRGISADKSNIEFTNSPVFGTVNTVAGIMSRNFYFAEGSKIANISLYKYPRYTNNFTPSLDKHRDLSPFQNFTRETTRANHSIHFNEFVPGDFGNTTKAHTGELKNAVGINIINNNSKGILHISNTLLSCVTSSSNPGTDLFIPLIVDNNFAKLNITNTNVAITGVNPAYNRGCYFNPGTGAFHVNSAPNKTLRGFYEVDNCNFNTLAISSLSSFYIHDPIKNLGLTLSNTTSSYITYLNNGNISSDKSTSISTLTNIPSERVTPISRVNKIKCSSKFVAIGPETTNATISVQVHTSWIGDSQVYNGTSPRLILRSNPSASINEDIVLATLPLNNDTRGKFTTLSASIPSVLTDTIYEFYVDCDGTLGWINVDNWQAT